jgi:hypothetical protein
MSYIIIDINTGIYDGSYAKLDDGVERYKSLQEEDPNGVWILVEKVMGTDWLPDHTFYTRHKFKKEKAIAMIKEDLTDESRNKDTDAENIYNWFKGQGFDFVMQELIVCAIDHPDGSSFDDLALELGD